MRIDIHENKWSRQFYLMNASIKNYIISIYKITYITIQSHK